MTHPPVNPSKIMQIGVGFWPSKVLLSAVELGLFTTLAKGPATAAALGKEHGLHARSRADFLDTLVALGFLTREGIGDTASYANGADVDLFLDQNKPTYMGGVLEMANARLYTFWGSLTEALRTGEPQNELKGESTGLFEKLYSDPEKLEGFMAAMQGVQMGNFIALSHAFDFSKYGSVCDVGGASGALAIQIAKQHPEVQCATFDLAPVAPIAQRHIEAAGLNGRVAVKSGNMFEEPLPRAKVITMGNILHDWDETQKKTLIAKAYDAVGEGGVFIAVENVIDNERSKNVFGLLMSLNMLIETPGGFDYTAGQFDTWCREAGFKSTEIMPLAGPTSAAIAFR